MFKNNERRFEYDISPHGPEEGERRSLQYGQHRNIVDHPISVTTPIGRRASVNHHHNHNQPILETRNRHHISEQEPSHFYEGVDGVEERHMPRQRGNSVSSGFKKSIEKPGRNEKSFVSQENFKQTKKIYFGGNDIFPKDFQASNQRSHNQGSHNQGSHKNGHHHNDQNRRMNGEESASFNFDEKIMMSRSNVKQNYPKQTKQRRQEGKCAEGQDYNLTEKEIMEKIGRINRLNEEINSRLQRMLIKIDAS